MRIDHSTNSDLISLQKQQTQLLPQSVPRRQTAVVLDSYSPSTASGTIIDAEYVEIFSISKIALPATPGGISSDFGPDQVNQSSDGQQQRLARHNPVNRYIEMAADTPIPGTYLNIFA
ncbi:hypothetical protein HUU61_25060 [Rhodopseudomonas palustris]|nr:hypothetical protein [Rhodopseudomonas palustris]